ncbi:MULTISPECIES: YgaP family membrane protein [Gordonia]|uniref:DUF2892 domain-containing protein n=1 Tax=Gordonia amicalis TaxID=89053 RepID=A0AAE4R519_9ACTN|nr:MULTISPECIES: DUF2892 domain-containing protein [Gordonia]ATD71559.1 DUF2892 domain-containing protein [Gordonia sp. 1D]MBA5849387.1 DUF2892 domain-containing protein [Gordonia amicalis]MCZ4579224.1 DUF2892 domain-containing protein [Gordonia amicalis]MDJ0452391.1 DUF2892 domain-containing protein [Gordonia amicalis]MDV6306403.1 DUF2892 domain-containing protein [Gordonia amicalis]
MTRATGTHEPRLTVERMVPALAGVMVTISVILVLTVSPWWTVLTLFVAANLLLYSAVGWCPASLLMSKAGLPRATYPR